MTLSDDSETASVTYMHTDCVLTIGDGRVVNRNAHSALLESRDRLLAQHRQPPNTFLLRRVRPRVVHRPLQTGLSWRIADLYDGAVIFFLVEDVVLGPLAAELGCKNLRRLPEQEDLLVSTTKTKLVQADLFSYESSQKCEKVSNRDHWAAHLDSPTFTADLYDGAVIFFCVEDVVL